MQALISKFKSYLEQARDRADAMDSYRQHELITEMHKLVDELDDQCEDGYFEDYISARDEAVRLRAWIAAMQRSGLANGCREMAEAALRGEMPPPEHPRR